MTARSDEGTEEIPLFPLGVVLFPGGWLPLRIFETRYVDMVRRCMREGSGFGVVLIREGAETGPAQIHEVGTLARIVDFHQLPDGLLGLTCRGEGRFRVRNRRRQPDGLNVGEVQWLAAEPAMAVPERHVHLSELLRKVMPQLGEPYSSMDLQLDDAAWVGHRIAEILPIAAADKQFCLELQDPIERLDALGMRA